MLQKLLEDHEEKRTEAEGLLLQCLVAAVGTQSERLEKGPLVRPVSALVEVAASRQEIFSPKSAFQISLWRVEAAAGVMSDVDVEVEADIDMFCECCDRVKSQVQAWGEEASKGDETLPAAGDQKRWVEVARKCLEVVYESNELRSVESALAKINEVFQVAVDVVRPRLSSAAQTIQFDKWATTLKASNFDRAAAATTIVTLGAMSAGGNFGARIGQMDVLNDIYVE